MPEGLCWRNRLKRGALALVIAFAVGLFWSWSFSGRGVEAIRTSDTTDVFYRLVLENKAERAEYAASAPSVLALIGKKQAEVFSREPLSEWYQGLFDAYLSAVYLATGDILDAYRCLVVPLNAFYFLGCYLLFALITRRGSLALGLAFLATLPVFIPLAGENFGMGPFVHFSRRHLFSVFVPWVLWGFFLGREDLRKLMVVFASLGLAANLHASGVLLIQILALGWLFQQGFSRRRLMHAALFALVGATTAVVAMGGLWGTVGGFLSGALSMLLPAAVAAGANPTGPAIPGELQYLFYPPHIYSHWPVWLVHIVTVLVSVLALLPLLLRGQFSARARSDLMFVATLAILSYLAGAELRFWLLAALPLWFLARKGEPGVMFELVGYLLISLFLISFGGMLLAQFLYLSLDGFPLIFNNLRGIRFVGVFIFVWLATLLAAIDFRTAKPLGRRLAIFFLCLAVFADLRMAYRKHFRDREQKDKEALMDVARWAKANTPPQSRFFVASSAFGVVAERKIFVNDKAMQQCPACFAPLSSENATEIVAEAMNFGMDYAVLGRESIQGAGEKVLYRNADYRIVAVARVE